jgi:glycosyltransferase involved in cell wall biosynthesis
VKRHGGVAILVYNIDSPGGMERQAERLAREIARQGRRVVLVSSFFPKKGIGIGRPNPPLLERREGVLIYRVPCYTNLVWSYLASQNLYETVAAWILEKHAAWVDTIYGVQAQSGGVHAARLAPVLERPALVKLACSGLSGDIVKALDTPQGKRVYDHLRALDRVVYLNLESRTEAADVGVADEKLVAIPNGIDLARFPQGLAPAPLPELGAASERELVLFVGRLSRQKRAHVLLEAFAGLAAKRPRARLALAGDGPERAALERRARELGLDGRVAFLGVRTDVPDLLRAADVFVLPSGEEGQSNALLEAMAAGAPCVATDIPGNRDMLADGRDGLLVPVDDAKALERAAGRLLEDRSLARTLARAGCERIRGSYSIESVARRYLALFDSLGERRKPSFGRFLARYSTSRVWGFSGVLAYVVREAGIQLGLPALAFVVRKTKRALGLKV